MSVLSANLNPKSIIIFIISSTSFGTKFFKSSFFTHPKLIYEIIFVAKKIKHYKHIFMKKTSV